MKRAAFVTSLVLSAGFATAAHASAPCYVAFIHGAGEKFDDPPTTSDLLEGYWTPDGSVATSFTHYAARGWDPNRACAVHRVGYDGYAEWWSHRAAGAVAASLQGFILEHAIPDGELVLVAHSMGGLVARYVLNNGTPGAPYYNEYVDADPRMDYDLVRRKTAYVISIQAPHTGAQGADALYGDADHALTNASASVIKVLGFHDTSAATAVMTRAYMEAAGANGGEMGDEGRTVTLYTIAGVSAGDASGNGMSDDGKLDLAWTFLCYQKGAGNSWGAGCRWDFWNFDATPGDGLVEQESAHGLWMRRSRNGQRGIAGARATWLDVQHNHNHGRYDAHAARIQDRRRGTTQTWYLGSYVGSHGLELPAPR